MSLWDDIPYELQSPSWRSALNHTPGTPRKWDPTLNTDKASGFLTAYQASKTGGGSGAGATVNTVRVDGGSNFLNQLSGLGAALLAGIGGQPETAPAPMPVAYTGGPGMDTKTMLIFAAAGLGLYFVATK